jgi:hypothetical protein
LIGPASFSLYQQKKNFRFSVSFQKSETFETLEILKRKSLIYNNITPVSLSEICRFTFESETKSTAETL